MNNSTAAANSTVLSLAQLLAQQPAAPPPCWIEPGLLPPQGILFVGAPQSKVRPRRDQLRSLSTRINPLHHHQRRASSASSLRGVGSPIPRRSARPRQQQIE